MKNAFQNWSEILLIIQIIVFQPKYGKLSKDYRPKRFPIHIWCPYSPGLFIRHAIHWLVPGVKEPIEKGHLFSDNRLFQCTWESVGTVFIYVGTGPKLQIFYQCSKLCFLKGVFRSIFYHRLSVTQLFPTLFPPHLLILWG